MQTFLPYPSFRLSAKALDMRRLGKQRVEAKQIYMAVERGGGPWYSHPAVQMWVGYAEALAKYGAVVCAEWRRRGYDDTLLPWFEERMAARPRMPWWWGDADFHASHRSNLKRKNPAYYNSWVEPDNLPYVWPRRKV